MLPTPRGSVLIWWGERPREPGVTLPKRLAGTLTPPVFKFFVFAVWAAVYSITAMVSQPETQANKTGSN